LQFYSNVFFRRCLTAPEEIDRSYKNQHQKSKQGKLNERLWFSKTLIALIKWELSLIVRLPFGHIFTALIVSVSASFRSRAALQLEILALRHQLGVLQRSVKRPKLTPADRLLWAWLSTAWQDSKCGAFIMKAYTVIEWHRKGFRLFWTWKIRRGKPGRPAVPRDVRELIRTMSRENPIWGDPRIYGELLKLSIEIGETSVSKYMVRRRRPPSQTWKTFLDNHVKSMVSVDFFAVPTIRFQILYVFLVLAHERRQIVSRSRRIRRLGGPPSKCARRFLGIMRPDICFAICDGQA
jgi:hypothetical protein